LRVEEERWETLSSDSHFHDAHVTVATEEVRTPACSSPRRWTTVHRKAAVAIAALTVDNKLVLIRQERIPIRARIWEVPAGQIDNAGATGSAETEAVALRELREETGYELSRGGKLTSLGHFFSSPGFTDEQVHFFLAHPVELSASGHAHEESESIVDCRAFSFRAVADMIANNEIRDANTLGICARLAARGFIALEPAAR